MPGPDALPPSYRTLAPAGHGGPARAAGPAAAPNSEMVTIATLFAHLNTGGPDALPDDNLDHGLNLPPAARRQIAPAHDPPNGRRRRRRVSRRQSTSGASRANTTTAPAPARQADRAPAAAQEQANQHPNRPMAPAQLQTIHNAADLVAALPTHFDAVDGVVAGAPGAAQAGWHRRAPRAMRVRPSAPVGMMPPGAGLPDMFAPGPGFAGGLAVPMLGFPASLAGMHPQRLALAHPPPGMLPGGFVRGVPGEAPRGGLLGGGAPLQYCRGGVHKRLQGAAEVPDMEAAALRLFLGAGLAAVDGWCRAGQLQLEAREGPPHLCLEGVYAALGGEGGGARARWAQAARWVREGYAALGQAERAAASALRRRGENVPAPRCRRCVYWPGGCAECVRRWTEILRATG